MVCEVRCHGLGGTPRPPRRASGALAPKSCCCCCCCWCGGGAPSPAHRPRPRSHGHSTALHGHQMHPAHSAAAHYCHTPSVRPVTKPCVQYVRTVISAVSSPSCFAVQPSMATYYAQRTVPGSLLISEATVVSPNGIGWVGGPELPRVLEPRPLRPLGRSVCHQCRQRQFRESVAAAGQHQMLER